MTDYKTERSTRCRRAVCGRAQAYTILSRLHAATTKCEIARESALYLGDTRFLHIDRRCSLNEWRKVCAALPAGSAAGLLHESEPSRYFWFVSSLHAVPGSPVPHARRKS